MSENSWLPVIGRGTTPAEILYPEDPPYYDGDSSYPPERMEEDQE